MKIFVKFFIDYVFMQLNIQLSDSGSSFRKSKNQVDLWHELILCLERLESQNHRMVGVGRDLCGSSSLTPLPKQGHLQQAAQDFIPVGFQYLQRRRLYNPSGQPGPVLCHPQSEEFLSHVQLELPMLQFVPVAPCPAAGHH